MCHLFSVIVPTFNREALLPRCLESLCRQSFQKIEIIVVDDGSTDQTYQLVKKWSERDSRVRYVAQQNQGAGAARNLGNSLAQGTLTAFLDSDDEVLPEWAEKMVQVFDDPEIAIACCGISFADQAGTIEKTSYPKQNGLFLSGTFVIRKALFDAVHGYRADLPANQHSELKLRLIPHCEKLGWKILSLDESLVVAHQHDGPKVRKNVQGVYDSAVYILKNHQEQLKSTPQRYSHWCSATGGCAAKLHRFKDARFWFREAIRTQPREWKNYLRLLLMYVPVLREKLISTSDQV